MLIFLAVSSISEAVPVSPEAAEELNGRVIDGQMIEELEPAVRYENGQPVLEISEAYEKYVPVIDVLDALITAIDKDIDLAQMKESGSMTCGKRTGAAAGNTRTV